MVLLNLKRMSFASNVINQLIDSHPLTNYTMMYVLFLFILPDFLPSSSSSESTETERAKS